MRDSHANIESAQLKGIWRAEAIIPVIEWGRKIIPFGKESHAFQLAVCIDQRH